jgi:GTPase SAR1 family protein
MIPDGVQPDALPLPSTQQPQSESMITPELRAEVDALVGGYVDRLDANENVNMCLFVLCGSKKELPTREQLTREVMASFNMGMHIQKEYGMAVQPALIDISTWPNDMNKKTSEGTLVWVDKP